MAHPQKGGWGMKQRRCATCAFSIFGNTLCALEISRIYDGNGCDNWIKKGAPEEKIKEIIDDNL